MSIFVPREHHDILVEAIKTGEHGGRVCGLRRSIDLNFIFWIIEKK